MPTKVFWLEPIELVRCYLRRYRSGSDEDAKCPSPYSYHNARYFSGDMAIILSDPDNEGRRTILNGDSQHQWTTLNDPNWPTKCDHCEYHFNDQDPKQFFVERTYRRVDTAETMTLRDAPAGAMWDAQWMSSWVKGADGICLVVKLPNGNDWMVDSRASNCTLPNDDIHKCWVRHGDPKTGNVHVDKNGVTCSAGAGSIASGNYHGFLHNGYLTDG